MIKKVDPKKVLVTGASGFIGYPLCQHLLKQGFQVIGVCRRKEEKINELSTRPLFIPEHIDLSKKNLPLDLLKEVDVIFHLAGLAHAGKKSNFSETDYQAINVEATKNLFNQAVKAGVRRFVYFSSVKAIDADDAYARSKRDAEKELLSLAKTASTEVVILRPALVYGPNLKGNLASMQWAIKKGRFPPIPKTHNKRSLISVQDLIDAACIAAEHPAVASKTYVITDHQSYSTRRIYEILCQSVGRRPLHPFLPSWVFRLAFRLIGRPDLFQKLLGDAFYSDNSPSLMEDVGWIPQLRFEEFHLNQ